MFDNFIFIKLREGDLTATLAELKKISANVTPHRPFEYQFLDQQHEGLYASEQRMSKISSVFASLAILIACLGLLGLVAFAAAQKTKEIGIRKVLGATVSNIVFLITQDYVRLVALSIAIGLPIAYWTVDHLFLDGFAYRTTIGVWPLIIAASVCFLFAFLTSGYQAIKAAFINPTETLRSE